MRCQNPPFHLKYFRFAPRQSYPILLQLDDASNLAQLVILLGFSSEIPDEYSAVADKDDVDVLYESVFLKY